jgi:hypothetical protein
MQKAALPLAGGLGLVSLISLILWLGGSAGPGKLQWDIRTKETVMTFAYKAYASPASAAGKYYLSKIVFQNDGAGPVRNVQVSYQIPEYVSWTTPEKYPEILPGQTVVEVYYPKLPAKVTELTSRTTTTLEIKIAWDPGDGKRREEIVKRDFDLRGVNEIEYTSMPASEIVSWYDVFENTDLVAAFVTTDDPVVKAFAGEVTKFAGGTTAGAGGGVSETARLMSAFYNYQVATGMHYASAKGVPEKLGDVSSLVQNIRLPREVIMNGSGLCIELAILWSAVMEHLGVKTYMVVIPGHAFTVVVDGGQWIPIECTGIGGAGIGGASSFADAVKSAGKTLSEAQIVKLVDIQALQGQGIRPPELPKADLQMVKNELDKRAGARRAPQAQPQPQPGPGPGPEPAPVAGFRTWTGAGGAVSVDYPQAWRVESTTVQNLQRVAPWVLHIAGDTTTGTAVEVYHWTSLDDLEEAVDEMRELVEMVGGTVRVEASQRGSIGKYEAIVVTGVTSYPGGSTRWKAVFSRSARGIVGVSAGTQPAMFETQKNIIENVIRSVKIR